MPNNQQNIDEIVPLLHKIVWDKESRKKLQKEGIDIVPSNFYSATPSFDEIENSFEYSNTAPPYMNESIFQREIFADTIHDLAKYSSEFNPSVEKSDNNSAFYWNNNQFSNSDAMSYYCMIRMLKPENIVEIGCGFSTLVAIEAVRKNGNGQIHCFDPYPKDFLQNNEYIKVYEKKAQDVSRIELEEILHDDDILFIDSTHSVKTGSDCNHIYLRLLPFIKKNLNIHVHDIFLPFGLPKKWAEDQQIYWTEQYLLYAFFLDNPKTKIIYSGYFSFNFQKNLLKKMMHDKHNTKGASIWFKYYNK